MKKGTFSLLFTAALGTFGAVTGLILDVLWARVDETVAEQDRWKERQADLEVFVENNVKPS